ncbi:hypothetical protein [Streptomyces zingiberis]|uniref:Uncharacterized protein n=1 Tax=Streptomyces zingiberis TaxID=2053010 RepID=A0ABX1C6J1_9ACTN|nr:hypothetical protein [Streptomyces zingiberis]NJQ02569.1 hypothetical protein [Streptomyces zingiberis]
MMFLNKIVDPLARTVSRRTGLPVAKVTRVLNAGLPIAAAALAKRRGKKR